MRSTVGFVVLAACSLSCGAATAQSSAVQRSNDLAIERGQYLVQIGGCNDCHTPGHLLGHPDSSRLLGGSDVGFALPTGVFVGPNLTSDKATGLGNWSRDQIVTAITTGVIPGGRVLASIMPWQDFSNLSHSDALAIATYLQTLPAVSHQVPAPTAAGQKPNAPFVMTILPVATYDALLRH